MSSPSPLQPASELGSNPIPAIHWSDLLQQLLDQQSLSTVQADQLMRGWLSDTIAPALSSAILIALQAKGICAAELVGMARVLQSQSQQRGCPSHSPIQLLWWIRAVRAAMERRRLISLRL
jgi:anthranilate phosphoribosyltransferase